LEQLDFGLSVENVFVCVLSVSVRDSLGHTGFWYLVMGVNLFLIWMFLMLDGNFWMGHQGFSTKKKSF